MQVVKGRNPAVCSHQHNRERSSYPSHYTYAVHINHTQPINLRRYKQRTALMYLSVAHQLICEIQRLDERLWNHNLEQGLTSKKVKKVVLYETIHICIFEQQKSNTHFLQFQTLLQCWRPTFLMTCSFSPRLPLPTYNTPGYTFCRHFPNFDFEPLCHCNYYYLHITLQSIYFITNVFLSFH